MFNIGINSSFIEQHKSELKPLAPVMTAHSMKNPTFFYLETMLNLEPPMHGRWKIEGYAILRYGKYRFWGILYSKLQKFRRLPDLTVRLAPLYFAYVCPSSLTIWTRETDLFSMRTTSIYHLLSTDRSDHIQAFWVTGAPFPGSSKIYTQPFGEMFIIFINIFENLKPVPYEICAAVFERSNARNYFTKMDNGTIYIDEMIFDN